MADFRKKKGGMGPSSPNWVEGVDNSTGPKILKDSTVIQYIFLLYLFMVVVKRDFLSGSNWWRQRNSNGSKLHTRISLAQYDSKKTVCIQPWKIFSGTNTFIVTIEWELTA